MDFSVLRPKPPAKKPEAPPPKPPPPSSAPPPLPPQHPPRGGAPPHPHHTPFRPYMEELDHYSHMQNLRSIECTNARTWRMNFRENPYEDQYDRYGNYEYIRHPYGAHNYDNHHHHQNMLAGLPPRLGLPPADHHRALHGPPSSLAHPPPDYHHGSQGPPPGPYYSALPASYYYGPPFHGGYFSDENPNGCMIM